ncbi:hypothetical protein, partial [Chlorobaculum thiosulfatiphilum]|uniref:hypothetical protein n=1 Tax=Chlorobaculum thiosulfatiphilum TaxID=115852 RepID=UPI001B8700AA
AANSTWLSNHDGTAEALTHDILRRTNFYMNMPCPLKVACKMAIGEFASLPNFSIFLPSKTIRRFRINSRLGSIFREVDLGLWVYDFN